MANVHVFKQNYRTISGDMSTELGAEDSIADAVQTPTFANMANYDLVRGAAQVSNVVATHVITLQMYEATAANGAGSAALTGFTDTYTSTQLTDIDLLECQVRGEDLSAGYQYVGARITTDDDDGDEVGTVWLVEGRARYKQATMSA